MEFINKEDAKSCIGKRVTHMKKGSSRYGWVGKLTKVFKEGSYYKFLVVYENGTHQDYRIDALTLDAHKFINHDTYGYIMPVELARNCDGIKFNGSDSSHQKAKSDLNALNIRQGNFLVIGSFSGIVAVEEREEDAVMFAYEQASESNKYEQFTVYAPRTRVGSRRPEVKVEAVNHDGKKSET